MSTDPVAISVIPDSNPVDGYPLPVNADELL